MDRKPKDGKEKSVQKLETNFIAKVEHAMERFTMWSEKLVKLSGSRKGYMTDEDRSKLASDYRELAEGILASLEAKPTEGKAQGGYKLR